MNDFFKPKENIELPKETQNSEPKEKKKIDTKKTVFFVLIITVFCGLSASSFHFYRQFKKASVALPAADTRDEVTKLTDEIKTFMILPEEMPTLATVTDVEQARRQPFFARAENGDKVLIYINAKKAILYRPSVKKIIEVANVSGIENLDEANTQETAPAGSEEENNAKEKTEETKAQAEPKVIKVAVYNGSNIKGYAAKLAGKIDDIENVKITKIANAKGNYEATFVADLNGQNADLCEKIAQIVGGQVGVFPEEEEMPEGADILVIGGSAL